jgi:hypothetical protein
VPGRLAGDLRSEREGEVAGKRLKKIYVYAENVFAAKNRTDRRRIRIGAPPST